MNIVFAVVIILVGLAALVGLGYSLWMIFDRRSLARSPRSFSRRVGRVLKDLCREHQGWVCESDIPLYFPGSDKVVNINYVLIADKFCYCIVCQTLTGALAGQVDDGFWTLYDLKGQSINLKNPMSMNAENAKDLEYVLTDGRPIEGDQIVLPVMVVSRQLRVDPRIVTREKGNYLFSLRYLARGISHIEASAVDTSVLCDRPRLIETLQRAKGKAHDAS